MCLRSSHVFYEALATAFFFPIEFLSVDYGKTFKVNLGTVLYVYSWLEHTNVFVIIDYESLYDTSRCDWVSARTLTEATVILRPRSFLL